MSRMTKSSISSLLAVALLACSGTNGTEPNGPDQPKPTRLAFEGSACFVGHVGVQIRVLIPTEFKRTPLGPQSKRIAWWITCGTDMRCWGDGLYVSDIEDSGAVSGTELIRVRDGAVVANDGTRATIQWSKAEFIVDREARTVEFNGQVDYHADGHGVGQCEHVGIPESGSSEDRTSAL